MADTHVNQWLIHCKGEVLRQTRSYKEIAGLSYEEFLDYIQDLNEISRYIFIDGAQNF